MEVGKQPVGTKESCSICGNLMTGVPKGIPQFLKPGRNTIGEKVTFKDVVRSSDAGCTYCAAIINAFLIFTPWNIVSDDAIWMPHQDDDDRNDILTIYSSSGSRRYISYNSPLAHVIMPESVVEFYITGGTSSLWGSALLNLGI